jgi:hypothetical protein
VSRGEGRLAESSESENEEQSTPQKKCKKPLDKPHKVWYNIYAIKRCHLFKAERKILMTITLGTVIAICITIVAVYAINAYVRCNS